MACYIVIFELKDVTQLPALKEALKSFSGFCPLTKRSWAIKTDQSAKEVRDKLAATMGPSDRLYVFRSGTEGAWRNAYSDRHSAWLKKNL